MLAGDTANVWEDVELRIYPDPFCTSCKISSMNKKARSKIPLKPKAPFKWVFMDIIISTASKSLTNDTTFYNYLLIVDAYSKIPTFYGMENITIAEVMDKLDMFQSRFGKIDEFGWWDLEIFSADAGTQFTLTKFKEECQTHGVRNDARPIVAAGRPRMHRFIDLSIFHKSGIEFCSTQVRKVFSESL